jgi:hypothetical protein
MVSGENFERGDFSETRNDLKGTAQICRRFATNLRYHLLLLITNRPGLALLTSLSNHGQVVPLPLVLAAAGRSDPRARPGQGPARGYRRRVLESLQTSLAINWHVCHCESRVASH